MAATTPLVVDDLDDSSATYPSEIQEFYKGSRVFITGGTGFMGQILLEKLLRSCPGIQQVYLLVRPKRDKQIQERLRELFDGPVFALIDADARAKVKPIYGDVALEDLGISPEDRLQLISDVTIVFHAAATVRFDEKLRTAISINVRGAQMMMALAHEMASLKAVIYISTAYANCPSKKIDENFFKPTTDGDTLQTLCNCLTDSQLKALQPELLGEWPNTYAFTKSAAEDTVRRYGKGLPLAVVRPSIVVNTADEPIRGWINNFYGPSGVTCGAAVGLLKTLHCNAETNADLVPVDKAINCCIAVAWRVAADFKSNQEHLPPRTAPPHIYNYVSSVERPITWGEYMRYNEQGCRWPAMQSVWCYFFTLNKHRSVHLLYVLFLHLLPAFLVDTLARLVGKKPVLWEAYRKVHKFSDVIAYFCTQQWQFTNDNTRALWLRLNPRDRQLFHFSMADINWQETMLHSIRGMRTYIMKESFTNIKEARRKNFKFQIAHYTITAILVLCLVRCLFWIASFIV